MELVKNQRFKIHQVIGGVILVVFVFFIGYALDQKTQADTITTLTNIQNTVPSVDSVFISSSANGLSDDFVDSISPNAGAVTTVHINGVVGDANGEADIVNVEMAFYRSLAAGLEACVADNNYWLNSERVR